MPINHQDIKEYRIDMTAKIKKALVRAGLSQVDIANHFNLSRARIGQIVNCYPGSEKRSEELLEWINEEYKINCH